jgi:hypothetical protein
LHLPRTTSKGGALGFVDDYSARVIGNSAQSAAENTGRLQTTVIPAALNWASQSAATFEADKTKLIHFTRSAATRAPLPAIPVRIGIEIVAPVSSFKLLGVIFGPGPELQTSHI